MTGKKKKTTTTTTTMQQLCVSAFCGLDREPSGSHGVGNYVVHWSMNLGGGAGNAFSCCEWQIFLVQSQVTEYHNGVYVYICSRKLDRT